MGVLMVSLSQLSLGNDGRVKQVRPATPPIGWAGGCLSITSGVANCIEAGNAEAVIGISQKHIKRFNFEQSHRSQIHCECRSTLAHSYLVVIVPPSSPMPQAIVFLDPTWTTVNWKDLTEVCIAVERVVQPVGDISVIDG